MTAKDIMKLLQKHGWYVSEIRGSHYQFEHLYKKGKITMPLHSGDLKPGTLNSILKQAGLK
jgi:predicted RNA binding protein YcfA (HicA-like mRNA interferase family)